LLACLAALATASAGCGGDDQGATTSATGPATATEGAPLSKEEYETAVSDALQPVIDDSQRLAEEAGTATSLDELADQLERAGQTYSDTASTLAEITPPADVADLHDRLVAASENLATATEDAQKAAAEGNEEDVLPFEEAGMEYQEELTKLSAEYTEKGYSFAPPGEATEGGAPTAPGGDTATAPGD
jgi:hypothetical protein